MNLRRAFTFAWRMALAYLRIVLSTTLTCASLVGLCVLVLIVTILIVNQLSGIANIGDALQLIFQVMALVSIGLSMFLSIGLVWNVIGVALGISIALDELTLKDLRVTIPFKLKLYNTFGMPLLYMLMVGLLGSYLSGVTCLGILTLILGFVSSEVACSAWKKVVDWYELTEQGITKKKNVSTNEKPKVEDTDAAADTTADEDDVVRLRKSR